MQKIPAQNGTLHKIGAVSSLSGVPTPTLRVWELRYETFQPHKTESQHRLYTDEDVLKATVLKRLTDQGHSISSIAKLSTTELNNLLQLQQESNLRKVNSDSIPQTVSLAVIGLPLAAKIESKKFTFSFNNQAIRITDIFSNVQEALAAKFQKNPQIILIHTNSLHAGVQVDIHRLAQNNNALQVIVLYNYGQETIIESLKNSGMIVRREPLSDSDLADLIKSVLVINNKSSTDTLPSGTLIPPRKYDDIELMRIARISSNVLCECPKHVSEIITQLASFEQYSLECLNNSKEDAHLHAHLRSVSGSARALFESALEMVAKHEGIQLKQSANPQS
jgi:MerR family transcriptional regulator, light-induced transcriptional regulator